MVIIKWSGSKIIANDWSVKSIEPNDSVFQIWLSTYIYSLINAVTRHGLNFQSVYSDVHDIDEAISLAGYIANSKTYNFS